MYGELYIESHMLLVDVPIVAPLRMHRHNILLYQYYNLYTTVKEMNQILRGSKNRANGNILYHCTFFTNTRCTTVIHYYPISSVYESHREHTKKT